MLTKRVEAAVAVWTAAFATTATSSTATDSNTATATTTAGATAGAHSLQLQPSVHEVLLRNSVLHLHPPLEQARHTWIRHLHSHVCTAALLPRLRSSRFAVFDEHDVSHSSFDTTMQQRRQTASSHLSYDCCGLCVLLTCVPAVLH